MTTKSINMGWSQNGFSLVELMVGLVAGGLVMAGAYSLWSTHNREGYRLEKKIELRNQISLSSLKIQRSITLAGLGLHGSANLEKQDYVGSDSLIIYNNPSEAATGITSGELLEGVRYTPLGAITHSLVMRSRSGTVRYIEAHHRIDKLKQL